VQFTDASSDPDGTIVNWTWSFGDGNVSHAQNPSHQYTAAGTYTVNLTVRDDDGAVNWTTAEIVVIDTSALIANFTYEPPNPVSLQPVHFIDASSAAAVWLWNFGDGTTASEQHPFHEYPIGNYYNVSLTVFNGSMNASAYKVVKVDTMIQLFENANNVVNYVPWLSNETSASELSALIGGDIMPTGSVVSRWNVSTGSFDSYVVGISPPSYDFMIYPYDAVVLRVANAGSFVETAMLLQDRLVTLFKNAQNVVNHVVWSSLNATSASELSALIGGDIMPTGSVVSRWNVSTGSFDSYVVGISPPSYDFSIGPGDCIVLRIANSGEFMIEVLK